MADIPFVRDAVSIRAQVLDDARGAVTVDRATSYGQPEDTFKVIADYWAVHLGHPVTPTDVAVMLGLLKIGRLRANPTHRDSWVDLAGYAACGYEVAVADD